MFSSFSFSFVVDVVSSNNNDGKSDGGGGGDDSPFYRKAWPQPFSVESQSLSV